MKKQKQPAVRFCGCDDEPLPSKPGMPVYVKAAGVMTLNRAEATNPTPIGYIDAKYNVEINATALEALNLLE